MNKKNYKTFQRTAAVTYIYLYKDDEQVDFYSVEDANAEIKKLEDKGYINRDLYISMKLMPPVKEEKSKKNIFKEEEQTSIEMTFEPITQKDLDIKRKEMEKEQSKNIFKTTGKEYETAEYTLTLEPVEDEQEG